MTAAEKNRAKRALIKAYLLALLRSIEAEKKAAKARIN